MGRIRQGPVWAVLEGVEGDPLRALQVSLSIEDPRAKYTKAFQWGKWDGLRNFLHRPHNRFLAGLTARVYHTLRAHGVEVGVTPSSRPTPYTAMPRAIAGVTLHSHQLAGIDMALRARRLALECPTGGGKTEIGAEWARRLGVRTLWLCHGRELLDQTYERLVLRLPGASIGRWRGGVHDTGDLTVAEVAAVRNIPKGDPWWVRWEALILDEVQHASAETWFEAACQCVRAGMRLGLSGTVLTKDPVRNMRLEGAVGPKKAIVDQGEVVTAQVLGERGLLAVPTIVWLRAPRHTYPSYPEVRERVLPTWRDNPRKLGKLGGALFGEAYRRGIMRNRARTAKLLDYALDEAHKGGRVLVLVHKVEHGQAILEALSVRDMSNLPVWWLHGEISPEDRRAGLDMFRGEPDGAILIASPIFGTGLDIPEVDSIYLAGGGEAETMIRQELGRGLRRRPDKPTIRVYDFADGRDPLDDKDYLAQHAAGRWAVWQAQGFAQVDEQGRPLTALSIR